MIKDVIFDIGNVLTLFSWEQHIRSFGFDDETFEKVADATARSSAWGEFDRGLEEDEVLKLFIKNDPSVEKEIRMMFENIEGTLSTADYAIPWILELKRRNLRTLILSNLSVKTLSECWKSLLFLNYTDGGILSFREGVIKPEEEIYTRLIERYDINPEEAVFIDDRSENIEAARRLGLNGIVFESYEQASAELEELIRSKEGN